MAKKVSKIISEIKRVNVPEKGTMTLVSYSQYSSFAQCPYKWYQTYVNNNRMFTSTIHTVFGTAMHETLQIYLTTFYADSVKAANNINLESLLKDRMLEVYEKEVENNGGNHFSSPNELREFYEDGARILEWFKKHRVEFFTYKGYELIGVEMPIRTPLFGINHNVYINGFIDLVLYDNIDDRIIIYDFKTSTRGWTDYEKKDEVKVSQVLIYKEYFSKFYGVDRDMIDVEFIILKRKIYEKADFPIPRIQKFKPANGKVKMNKAVENFSEFIKFCFNPDGTYASQNEFPKIPSTNNCRFCPFSSKPELCDKIN